MSLKITVKSVVLTQAQVDACLPIMNDRMRFRKMSDKLFEETCIAAMKEAGCPLELPTDGATA